MSAPAPTRRSRGRVLIVGDAHALRARLPEFTDTPEYASDLFDAIARLGTRQRGDVRAPITGTLIEKIVPFKRQTYEVVLGEFAERIASEGG